MAAHQGLEILHQLNGKTFDELADVDEEDYQTKFRNTTLPARIIRVDSSEDGVFEVYRRINSGSMNLLEQQIRRAFFKYVLLSSFDNLQFCAPFTIICLVVATAAQLQFKALVIVWKFRPSLDTNFYPLRFAEVYL